MRAVVIFAKNIFEDDIPGLAAETAFFLLVSLFPLALILASILQKYSAELTSEVLNYLLPTSIAEFLSGVMVQMPVFSKMPLIAVILSLWSASRGIWALMRGICKAYTGNNPKRPLLSQFIALFFVLIFIALIAFGLTIWFVGESLLHQVDGVLSAVIFLIKYSVSFLGIFLFVFGLYLYTPGYNIKKRDMIPGAAAASVAWLIANDGFEIYISNFSNYSALYGSVGAFLGLVIWLFLISIVILAGAEINSARLQYHTERDNKKNQ